MVKGIFERFFYQVGGFFYGVKDTKHHAAVVPMSTCGDYSPLQQQYAGTNFAGVILN